MNEGSLVKIRNNEQFDYHRFKDKIGMIVSFGKRLYVPAARVLIIGDLVDFDLNELEVIDGS